MKARISSYLQNDFLRHNAIFFVGSLVVAVLNYLYHPVMSRLLSVEDFGEVQVLFSIFTQLSIVIMIANIVLLNLYTNGRTYESVIVKQSLLLVLYVALGIALLLTIAAPYLVAALKLSSVWDVLLIAGALVATMLVAAGRAHLQATHKFALTSSTNALLALGKLLFAGCLVWMGLAVTGAIGGLLCAALVALIYVKYYVGPYLHIPKLHTLRFTPELLTELRYGGLVLCGIGVVLFFITADVILAKYLFAPDLAGYYAGVSVVAKIIYFATASVATVLLSHITFAKSALENKRTLRNSLFLTCVIAGGGLLIFTILSTVVMHILVGASFAPYADYLPLVSIYILFVSLINVCVNFAIALRQKSVITVGIFGVISTLALVYWFPKDMNGLIMSFCGGSMLTFLLCAYYYVARPINQSYGTSTNSSPAEAIN